MAKLRLPTEIKKLKGTLQKCRTNFDEPQYPKVDWIPAPEYFGEVAKNEWDRVIALLCPIGVVRESDLVTVEAYCVAYENYRICSDLAKTQDPFVRDLNGIPKKNPVWQQMNECLAIMIRLSVELGLTPSSRSRTTAAAPKDKGSFDDF